MLLPYTMNLKFWISCKWVHYGGIIVVTAGLVFVVLGLSRVVFGSSMCSAGSMLSKGVTFFKMTFYSYKCMSGQLNQNSKYNLLAYHVNYVGIVTWTEWTWLESQLHNTS